jgi:protein subunit release factor B
MFRQQSEIFIRFFFLSISVWMRRVRSRRACDTLHISCYRAFFIHLADENKTESEERAQMSMKLKKWISEELQQQQQRRMHTAKERERV